MPNSVWASDRLVYRAVEESDDAFLQDMSNDAVSWTNASHFLPTPQGKDSAKGTREWLSKCTLAVIICLPVGSPDAPPAPPPAAAAATTNGSKDDKKDDKKEPSKPQPTPIGFIALMTPDKPLMHHRYGSIAITLSKDFHAKGFGSESIRWLLEWAFLHANFHRVEIGAFEWNTGALRLYERLGFVPETRKRQHLYYKGRYWDMIEFGMLDDEWKKRYGAGLMA